MCRRQEGLREIRIVHKHVPNCLASRAFLFLRSSGLRGYLPSMYLHLALCCLQSSGKSSVLESIVGRDFLPRGSGIQVNSVLPD